MDLYINLPILLNKERKVDYQEIKSILNRCSDVDGLILFSSYFEGLTFTLKEKEEIYLNLKKMTSIPLIYDLNCVYQMQEIELVKKLNPAQIIFSLYEDSKISSKSFEKYLNYLIKKLKIPSILHIEDSFSKCKINYISLINLLRTNKYFNAIYYDSKDNNLFKKILYLNNLKIYRPLINFVKDAQVNFQGVVSSSYVVFFQEINQFLYEYKHEFVNPILKSYLSLINDCLIFYPLGMAIKYLLSKNGYTSIYSKPPYYLLKNEEMNKLDLLF